MSKTKEDTYTVAPLPVVCDRCNAYRPKAVAFHVGRTRRRLVKLCWYCVKELAVYLQGGAGVTNE